MHIPPSSWPSSIRGNNWRGIIPSIQNCIIFWCIILHAVMHCIIHFLILQNWLEQTERLKLTDCIQNYKHYLTFNIHIVQLMKLHNINEWWQINKKEYRQIWVWAIAEMLTLALWLHLDMIIFYEWPFHDSTLHINTR